MAYQFDNSDFNPDFYARLGLPRFEPVELPTLRAEFRKRAGDFHPDKDSSAHAAQQYALYEKAKKTLSTPDAKRAYDDALKQHISFTSTATTTNTSKTRQNTSQVKGKIDPATYDAAPPTTRAEIEFNRPINRKRPPIKKTLFETLFKY